MGGWNLRIVKGVVCVESTNLAKDIFIGCLIANIVVTLLLPLYIFGYLTLQLYEWVEYRVNRK